MTAATSFLAGVLWVAACGDGLGVAPHTGAAQQRDAGSRPENASGIAHNVQWIDPTGRAVPRVVGVWPDTPTLLLAIFFADGSGRIWSVDIATGRVDPALGGKPGGPGNPSVGGVQRRWTGMNCSGEPYLYANDLNSVPLPRFTFSLTNEPNLVLSCPDDVAVETATVCSVGNPAGTCGDYSSGCREIRAVPLARCAQVAATERPVNFAGPLHPVVNPS